MKRIPGVKEISLRPYAGRMFIAKSRTAYEKGHQEIFKEPDVLNCATAGRFSGGAGKDGMWTYLVWCSDTCSLAHELSHVVLHVFDRVGIDPREAGGEPFCYMLQHLMDKAMEK